MDFDVGKQISGRSRSVSSGNFVGYILTSFVYCRSYCTSFIFFVANS
jgi:hypothetical protein